MAEPATKAGGVASGPRKAVVRGRNLDDAPLMRMSTVSLVGVLVVAALSGCGGSSGSGLSTSQGGTCMNTPACGGNLVGTWTISSSCVTESGAVQMTDPQCPTATVSTPKVSITGSATFNADKTYTENDTTSGTADLTLPASCLTSGGITLTCAQFSQAFAQVVADPTSGIKSATCAGSSSCTCHLVLADTSSTEMGTYTTTAAGVLTQTPNGGTASDSSYCVSGTKLTESPTMSVNMGNMGTVTLTGTITLTKQ